MSMNAAKARLTSLTKQLLRQWGETRESWRDSKSLEFEARFMSELEANVGRAAATIEQLDKLVTKVRKDCE